LVDVDVDVRRTCVKGVRRPSSVGRRPSACVRACVRFARRFVQCVRFDLCVVVVVVVEYHMKSRVFELLGALMASLCVVGPSCVRGAARDVAGVFGAIDAD